MRSPDAQLSNALRRDAMRARLQEYMDSLRQDELERLAAARGDTEVRMIQGRASMLADLSKMLKSL